MQDRFVHRFYVGNADLGNVDMPRFLRRLLASLLLASAAAATGDGALPRPVGLEPAIRFWLRIYTEVESSGGVIHDSRNLEVVYETLSMPSGTSTRALERRSEERKREYRKILERLARGKRSELSAEEERVLSLWPPGVSNQTLKQASRRLRFQLGQADRFRRGLIRSGAWREHIQQTLDDHDVPPELVALPHVESSYNPAAYSRVGAAGLWQFTRSTGRRFLRVDSVVDERLDPHKASVAAARLLRENYKLTGTWPLAITAYNHGASGMRRATRKLGTSEIDKIISEYRGRTFGFASRNFYASFLAASSIDENPVRYFGRLTHDPPEQFTRVELPHFYRVSSLTRALGIGADSVRRHNPDLRPAVWNENKYVPRGYQLRLPARLAQGSAEALLERVPKPDRMAQQHRDRFHKVRRGDSLSAIAHRYRVSERELMELNNLRNRHRIRVGQVLVLPDRARGGSRQTARNARPTDGIYHVQRGDSISRVANRFGVSEADLVEANALNDPDRIKVGLALSIPEALAPGSVSRAKTPSAPPTPTVSPPARRNAEASPPAAAARPPVGDPSDYSVHARDEIIVQADETLGHYAEWLETSASHLRRINGLPFGREIVIGRPVRLDFTGVSSLEFEQRRLDYHRSLQEEFFSAFRVTGTTAHTLRNGDTLWDLATQEYRVPVWLLRQYNPDLDFGALAPGTTLQVPQLATRSDQS